MKHTLGSLSKIAAVSAVLMSSLILAGPAGAFQPIDPPPGGGLPTEDTTGQQAICEGSGGSWLNGSCSNGGPTVMQTIGNVTNILLYVAGAISVVMIMVGGIRYITSSGDQSGTTSAKDTILYAVIGLVVTFIAYAIVNFVLVQVFK